MINTVKNMNKQNWDELQHWEYLKEISKWKFAVAVVPDTDVKQHYTISIFISM